VLESGWLLQIIPPADRKQELVLRFAADDGALSERSVEKCVTVNHPAVHGGWRFYLMSYDREAQEYVVLLARRDPGRGIAIAGMFCLMAGVALTCFVRR
jgi:cytochrome c biogenesis protein ResB